MQNKRFCFLLLNSFISSVRALGVFCLFYEIPWNTENNTTSFYSTEISAQFSVGLIKVGDNDNDM